MPQGMPLEEDGIEFSNAVRHGPRGQAIVLQLAVMTLISYVKTPLNQLRAAELVP